MTIPYTMIYRIKNIIIFFIFEIFILEAAFQSCSEEKNRTLKIDSKFTEGQPCQSVISIKLQSKFIEITPQHEFSLVSLPHIFRTSFSWNTSGGLLLSFLGDVFWQQVDCQFLQKRFWELKSLRCVLSSLK